MTDRYTQSLLAPEFRQRLRNEAQYLRARAQGIQQTGWALQRRAQDLRADMMVVQERAACAQHRAAMVWDETGWLRDVELEEVFPLLVPQTSAQREKLLP